MRERFLLPILAALPLSRVSTTAAAHLPPAAGAPQVGERAPDFVLQDAEGREVRLSDLLRPAADTAGPGSWVLLSFYRGYW